MQSLRRHSPSADPVLAQVRASPQAALPQCRPCARTGQGVSPGGTPSARPCARTGQGVSPGGTPPARPCGRTGQGVSPGGTPPARPCARTGQGVSPVSAPWTSHLSPPALPCHEVPFTEHLLSERHSVTHCTGIISFNIYHKPVRKVFPHSNEVTGSQRGLATCPRSHS